MQGYALVEKASGATLVTYTSAPNRISLPDKPEGALVMGDDLAGWENDDYRLDTVMLPDPPPPGPPQIISDRQFFQQLAVLGQITQGEALAAVMTGAIPAALETVIGTLPQEQQFSARMLLSGATTFDRLHPMTALLAQGMGWTQEQINQLWSAAASL